MSQETSNTIAVQVINVPAAPVAVVLDEGATVGDAIEKAGLSAQGMTVRSGGSEVRLDAPATNGGKIYLARQIKGN